MIQNCSEIRSRENPTFCEIGFICKCHMFVPCADKICIKLFIIIFCLNKNNKCFYKCKYVIIIKFLILFSSWSSIYITLPSQILCCRTTRLDRGTYQVNILQQTSFLSCNSCHGKKEIIKE